MKKMMLALGYVAMLAAVVNLAGCRLYECDVDSVDVDDALLYEQVPVPDEDNAFIPLIAATNLLHRVEDECARRSKRTDCLPKMRRFSQLLRRRYDDLVFTARLWEPWIS